MGYVFAKSLILFIVAILINNYQKSTLEDARTYNF